LVTVVVTFCKCKDASCKFGLIVFFLPYILAFGHLVAVVVIVFIALVIVVTH
jgi:hypothetical protein